MLVAAIDSFAAFLAIGLIAVLIPHSRYDVFGARLRGLGTRAAVIFTASGRWRALTALGVFTCVLFAILRQPLWIPLAILASQIASQAVIDGVKRLFRRSRPGDYLVTLEKGFSYPSGHASTAVTFFCAWAVVAWSSTLPAVERGAIATILVVWAFGIAWSRVALRAHYVTDVIGGWLFGTGWLLSVLAVASMLGHAL